jgi:hypothetical protein
MRDLCLCGFFPLVFSFREYTFVFYNSGDILIKNTWMLVIDYRLSIILIISLASHSSIINHYHKSQVFSFEIKD